MCGSLSSLWSLLPARPHETQVALGRSESRGAERPGRKGIWGSVRVGVKLVHCRPGARVTAFFKATPLTSTFIIQVTEESATSGAETV